MCQLRSSIKNFCLGSVAAKRAYIKHRQGQLVTRFLYGEAEAQRAAEADYAALKRKSPHLKL